MEILSACLTFLQRLIQTPSLPGEEEAIALLVASEMKHLGYDEVYLDEAGNVIGLIRGRGEAPAVMFNTHLDHVDPGDEQGWPFPPYSGTLADGDIWGRGAVDIKGPLAAQVHGIARLKADGPPPGDVYVTAVVQEEIGGLGARHLLTHLHPPLVVVGEPSRNELRAGHRGRTELQVHFQGRSAHASMPDQGINPLFALARFLCHLEHLSFAEDAFLGSETLTPTLVETDQRSANVIPGHIWLRLDWRTLPSDHAESMRHHLQHLAEESAQAVPGVDADVAIPTHVVSSYTGLRMPIPASHPAFRLATNHPALLTAQTILADALGHAPPIGFWQFATDGGHFAEAGLTVIGFGPGDDRLAHTNHEHIPIVEIEKAISAYAALARAWPKQLQEAQNNA